MKEKKCKAENLEMKKLTLIAWAKILYKEGWIDLAKRNKMISMIERLTP